MESVNNDLKHVNRIRVLAAETVQKANSGHPGGPMGGAPMGYVLFSKIMKYDPHSPKWWNRDRFVLSNGHVATLLYINLHLAGYNISIEDLKHFRRFGSITPGHPELHVTPGVEVSTGPLGQGLTNAIGMSIAEKHLAGMFNKENFTIFDNDIYCLTGDGCLQEGITAEACSLAGHLGLDNIYVLYDDNHITIDGATDLSFTEDVLKRFEAYGWYTDRVEQGDTNINGIYEAIQKAKTVRNQPHIIAVHTTIGYGSKDQNTSKVHGTPLGWDTIEQAREFYGLENDGEKTNEGRFFIGQDTYDVYKQHYEHGIQQHEEWIKMLEEYKQQYPTEYNTLRRMMSNELVDNYKSKLPVYHFGDKDKPARVASGEVLNAVADTFPELIGGSADLTPSNNTKLNHGSDFTMANPQGNYIRFGIREHAMAAICNGIRAYGGLLPFCSTFFVFTNYLAGAMRMSAIMKLKVLYVLTHDSIGVGEDGPTHQPIEQYALIRAMPNIHLIRPADANEVVGAYNYYLQGELPTVLALSRQALPILEHSNADLVSYGAYIIDDCEGKPDLILVGTGSEVSICVNTKKILSHIKVRVISMPCTTLYEEQSPLYKYSLFPAGVPIISVEAASTLGWRKYAHVNIGIDSFGISCPANEIYEYFRITPKAISSTALQIINYYRNRTPCDLVSSYSYPKITYDVEDPTLFE